MTCNSVAAPIIHSDDCINTEVRLLTCCSLHFYEGIRYIFRCLWYMAEIHKCHRRGTDCFGFGSSRHTKLNERSSISGVSGFLETCVFLLIWSMSFKLILSTETFTARCLNLLVVMVFLIQCLYFILILQRWHLHFFFLFMLTFTDFWVPWSYLKLLFISYMGIGILELFNILCKSLHLLAVLWGKHL